MSRMLLVLNGADYSREAVRKAAWTAKNHPNTRFEMLYINPSSHELYRDIPGYSFWLPDGEFKKLADSLRKKVMREIAPFFQEMDVPLETSVRDGNIDREIGALARHGNYDHIFIASPSKYCGKGGGRVKKKVSSEISQYIVCLI